MNAKEEWRDVVGYEGLYEVSNLGSVTSKQKTVMAKNGTTRSYPRRKLKQYENSSGYMRVHLCKDGSSKTVFVHRVVAMAFIPNPEGLPQVNHINEDKTDNRACNLEWMSCASNVNHGTGKVRCGKAHEYPVVMTMPDGSETEFSSATAAANALGIVSQGIQHCCAGRMQSYKGCRWRYRDRHRARIEADA